MKFKGETTWLPTSLFIRLSIATCHFGVVEHTHTHTPTRVDETCPSGYINFYMENGKERFFFNGHVLVEMRFKNLWDFRRIVQKKWGEIPDWLIMANGFDVFKCEVIWGIFILLLITYYINLISLLIYSLSHTSFRLFILPINLPNGLFEYANISALYVYFLLCLMKIILPFYSHSIVKKHIPHYSMIKKSH